MYLQVWDIWVTKETEMFFIFIYLYYKNRVKRGLSMDLISVRILRGINQPYDISLLGVALSSNWKENIKPCYNPSVSMLNECGTSWFHHLRCWVSSVLTLVWNVDFSPSTKTCIWFGGGNFPTLPLMCPSIHLRKYFCLSLFNVWYLFLFNYLNMSKKIKFGNERYILVLRLP